MLQVAPDVALARFSLSALLCLARRSDFRSPLKVAHSLSPELRSSVSRVQLFSLPLLRTLQRLFTCVFLCSCVWYRQPVEGLKEPGCSVCLRNTLPLHCVVF